MKKILFPILAAAALVLVSGCAAVLIGGAAAAGAGTVMYVNGELTDTEEYSLDAVHVATVAGVRDMQFVVVNTAKDTAHVKLTVRTDTDEKIEITLIKQSPNLTEIHIRVGTFGEEQLSRKILDKIKSHL